MKLQKATLFALYAVLELAREPGRQISVAEIADTYGISANHLAKVLRDLGRAGLVEAVRGKKGGYRFAANPRRTSLYDVIDLFDDITEPGNGDGGETGITRALGRVLHEVDEIAVATLKSVSIATLLKSMEREAARQAAPVL